MSQSKSSDETLSVGQKVADKCSKVIGSWNFIIIQSTLLALWIFFNLILPTPKKWDKYPFMFLNIMLSFQAAYTGPVLLMAANRQSEIDRKRAIENFDLDKEDHKHLLEVSKQFDKRFEELNHRIDRIESCDVTEV